MNENELKRQLLELFPRWTNFDRVWLISVNLQKQAIKAKYKKKIKLKLFLFKRQKWQEKTSKDK